MCGAVPVLENVPVPVLETKVAVFVTVLETKVPETEIVFERTVTDAVAVFVLEKGVWERLSV